MPWILGCAAPEPSTPDSDPPEAHAPAPWDEDAFWDTPGPLADLVFPESVLEARWIVRVATREAGGRWGGSPQAVLRDFNSFDVIATPRGLVLVGLLGATGRYNPDVASVAVFATQDLVQWSTHIWEVEDARGMNIVDPSLHRRPDGTYELIYFGTTQFGVDPVWLPGPHAIRRAPWDEDARVWREDPEDVVAYEGAVDPVVCNVGDEEWLFSTQSAVRVVADRLDADGHLDHVPFHTWEGHSVPFCREHADGLEVVAQSAAASGPPRVAQFVGERFEDRGDLYEPFGWSNEVCTSPVIVASGSRDLLFCAFLNHLVPPEHDVSTGTSATR
ncbi:MAG: hypothetical protein RLZZ299_1550 [Pseudomonadota bacterium]